jgi:hypothetical protein
MISKSQRQLLLFESLKAKKRARPEDLLKTLVDHHDMIETPALKRAVLRDLKEFMDSHQVGVDYFTPSGSLIPPGEEEQHRNYRVEYYLLGEPGSDVAGIHMWEAIGGSFLCRSSLATSFCWTQNFEQIPKKNIYLGIQHLSGFLFLYFSREDLPIELIFARAQSKALLGSQRTQTLAGIGRRSAVIGLPDHFTSRYQQKQGHGSLNFDRQGESLVLMDHNSTHGTGYSQDQQWLDYLKSLSKGWDQTSELMMPPQLVELKKSQQQLPLPIYISIGKTALMVDLS